MKYFKPELLASCRSLDDDMAEAAAEELEQARIAYHARLRAIRSSLPRSVRQLLSTASLHDAKVLGMSLDRRSPRFALRIRLEGTRKQPSEVVELSYRSVAGPNGGVAFSRHRNTGNGPQESLWVLYNEFDVDEDRGFFTHSILLTSGIEINVRFYALHVAYLEEIASPLELKEEERTWPLVEA